MSIACTPSIDGAEHQGNNSNHRVKPGACFSCRKDPEAVALVMSSLQAVIVVSLSELIHARHVTVTFLAPFLDEQNAKHFPTDGKQIPGPTSMMKN